MPGILVDNIDGDYDCTGYGKVLNTSSNMNISKQGIYANGNNSDTNFVYDTSPTGNGLSSGDKSSDDFKLFDNMLVPFLSDSMAQKTDLQYLKNKTLDKMSTNYEMSSFGIGSNP
jgi:hypothetical protein